MQDILWLTEWVLAMSTWICHMATKRKEWSRRALCVGNQNTAVRAYGCIELTKSLWQSKVSIFIKTFMSNSGSGSILWRNWWKVVLGFFLWNELHCAFHAPWRKPSPVRAFRRCCCCCFWLLSIKGKLASMTCWMVCFNRQGQLQRLVVFFLQPLAGGLHARCIHGGVNTVCVSGSLEGLLSAGACGGVLVADKARIQRQLLLL